jgi:anti-sigma regulatory factor (Ser/Thr protein kinase)
MAETDVTRLTVTGDPDDLGDSLQALRDFVVSACNQAGLDKQRMSRLRLAVDEIATNIILYGYRDAGLSGDVTIESAISSDSLRVSLIDTAVAFDPTKHDMPDNLEDALENRNIGGLGIYLVIQNIDEFRYERIGNRNCNHFIMKRMTQQ